MEACLTVKGPDGSIVPGYGWVFPAGNGIVNIGVGALSTMKNFSDLNLNTMLDAYTAQVRDSWGLGEFIARPKAWRLPMHVEHRGGPGWVVVGDAAGLVNPFNGEGIDYALESGRHIAECFLAEPGTAWASYQAIMRKEYDPFFATARRFAWLIGRPKLLQFLLGIALSTKFTMRIWSIWSTPVWQAVRSRSGARCFHWRIRFLFVHQKSAGNDQQLLSGRFRSPTRG